MGAAAPDSKQGGPASSRVSSSKRHRAPAAAFEVRLDGSPSRLSLERYRQLISSVARKAHSSNLRLLDYAEN